MGQNDVSHDIVRIAAKPRRKVIGLISGTSADGVDAALVDMHGHGLSTQLQLLAFLTVPFPPALKQDLLQLCHAGEVALDDLCRMNVILGEQCAEAAWKVVGEAGMTMEEVDLIGSHGQTIRHLPRPTERYGRQIRASLQIGEPCVIAERTGVTTVADFRARDLAAGGEGAPLVPLVDYLLFRSAQKSRGMLNIGGIANITVLPADGSLKDVMAFDLGPGNMIIDELMRNMTSGTQAYDRNGEMASRGHVHPELLEELMGHPYLAQPPPKSTGREEFGAALVRGLLRRGEELCLSSADIMATATAFTARTILLGYDRFIREHHPMDELVVSGGGAHNRTLMRLLEVCFDPIEVKRLAEMGVSVDSKEAVAFAVLANETITGGASNVIRVTGASRPVVLGKIVPGTGQVPGGDHFSLDRFLDFCIL